MNATNTAAHLAGRLVLAIADDDGTQVIALMHEAATQPGGILALVVELSTIATGFAHMVSGDEWRSVMVDTLNSIEVDDEPPPDE